MRFSIRDLLWLTVVVALAAAWRMTNWQLRVEHKRHAEETAELRREKQAAQSELFKRQGELAFLRHQLLQQRARELVEESLRPPHDLLHYPGRRENRFERPDLEQPAGQ